MWQVDCAHVGGFLRAHALRSVRLCGRWTALMWAAFYGHLRVVELIIAAGADVAAQTNSGCACAA